MGAARRQTIVSWHAELACVSCGWSRELDPAGAADWLTAQGQLRDRSDADSDTLWELLVALSPRQCCTSCGNVGLRARRADREPWPEAPRCQSCGKAIPPERLEVFPSAERCAKCQQGLEQSSAPPIEGYCERCGAPLVLRPSSGAGVTRYRLVCTAGCHASRRAER